MEGETEAFAIDVRSYPGRTPTEPDTEKVVRGARDGFVENIVVNTALIRRRIRDPRLRNEMVRVGIDHKRIFVLHMSRCCKSDLVKIIKQELTSIEIDGITMADKTVENLSLNKAIIHSRLFDIQKGQM